MNNGMAPRLLTYYVAKGLMFAKFVIVSKLLDVEA